MAARRGLKDRSKRLAKAERELRAAMHPDVEKVLRGKRLVLLKRLLEETGYPDVHPLDDLVAGFPLIRKIEQIGVWPARDRPPTRNEATLLKTAKWAQHAAKSVRRSVEKGIDEEAWQSTLEEASPDVR